MYESPIYLVYEQMGTNIAREIDEVVIEQTMKVGINVDRDEMIKALKYDRGQYDKGYADGLEAGKCKWIRVADRLPEEDLGACIVYDGFEVQHANHYIIDGEHSWNTPDCYESEEIRGVTHWMPLPEPPKEDEQ